MNKPNVLFILADDLGWTDLGCYGNKFHETPNIDKLCKKGVKFTSAYAAAPVCSATRASILTGWTPARQHLVDVTPHNRDNNYSEHYCDYTNWKDNPIYETPKPHSKWILAKQLGQLPIGRPNFASILKENGYKTALIGKWHLGPDKDKYPTAQGFDINIGGNNFGWPPSYHSPYHNDCLSDCSYGDEYLTDRLTDEAVKFMNECTQTNQPFLCYLSHYAVHTPLQGKKEYVEYFKGKAFDEDKPHNPVYAAMIKSLDDSVGVLLQTLDNLNIRDNTMIIFYSDNGALSYPEGYFPKEAFGGYDSVTSSNPLRGFKATLYEGGIRVPLIMQYGDKFAKGVTSCEPVYSCDFFPTILDFCDAQIPPQHPTDGKSLLPIATGRKNKLDRKGITFFFPWASWLEAYGFKDYLEPSAAIRYKNFKLIKVFYGERMLFDLDDDIGEENDISQKQPQLADKLENMLLLELSRQNAHIPLANSGYNINQHNKYIKQLKMEKNIKR